MSSVNSLQRSTSYGHLIRHAIRKGFSQHPALFSVGAMMIGVFLVSLIGIFVDPQVITGAPAWVKPSKFAISICFYSFTLLWILNYIQGHKRLVSFITNVVAASFFVEMALIIVQVVRGTSSHFNISTPLDQAIYVTMGIFIVCAWLMTIVVAILLLRQKLPNPVFALSLRLGILLSIVGMAVAFFMVIPTTQQLTAAHLSGHMPYVGAHSVGVPDGGPGIPYLGWSTVGGDLRIPHFVGLHALQILPIFGWLLLQLPSKVLLIGHKLALLWIFGTSYLCLIALLTWQALRAQSIVHPDIVSLSAFSGLAVITIVACIIVVLVARRNHTASTFTRED